MRFLREVSGSVALPIAFMLPVLLVATGAAVDYSNIVNERMRLQNVLDEAVIRSLRRPVMTDDERKDVVENTVENSDSCDATVVAMADDVSASAVAE